MLESKAARRRARRGCFEQSSGDPDMVAPDGFDKLLRLEGKVGTLMEKMKLHDELCEEVEVRLAMLEKVFLFVDVAKLNAAIGLCSSGPAVQADEIDPVFVDLAAEEPEAVPLKLQLDKLLMLDETSPPGLKLLPINESLQSLEEIPGCNLPLGLELFDMAEDDNPDADDGFYNFTGEDGVAELDESQHGREIVDLHSEDVANGDQLSDFTVEEKLEDVAVGGQLTAVHAGDARDEAYLQEISVIFQDFQSYHPGVVLTEPMKKTIVNQVAESHGLSEQFIEKGLVLSISSSTES